MEHILHYSENSTKRILLEEMLLFLNGKNEQKLSRLTDVNCQQEMKSWRKNLYTKRPERFSKIFLVWGEQVRFTKKFVYSGILPALPIVESAQSHYRGGEPMYLDGPHGMKASSLPA